MTVLPLAEFDADSFALKSKQGLHLTVGNSPDGAPINLAATVITGGARRPRVVVVAGVHGDEFEGIHALARLTTALNADEVYGTLVIVPVLNPPAHRAASRVSSVDGLNLNRLFPGDPKGCFSQRLAFQIFHNLVKDSDLLVDLHSGGTNLLHAPLAGYYETGTSAGSESLRAAKAMNLPNIWRLPMRAGVLSFEAIQAGVPAVGAELGGGGRCLDQDVLQYQNAVRNVLKAWQVLEGTPTLPTAQRVFSGDWILAPTSGYLHNHASVGQPVRRGQELVTIRSMDDAVLARIVAQEDGWIMGLRTFPTVYEGEPAIMVLHEGGRPSAPSSVN